MHTTMQSNRTIPNCPNRYKATLRGPKSSGGTVSSIPSGCSIWMDDGAWEPEKARIIAVETGLYTVARAVKGTYWGAVARLLWEAFPDLKPAMRLHCDWRALQVGPN